MCGFVAELIFGNVGEVDAPTLVKMRDRLTHRGPDAAGVWVSPDKRAGLGHRRLSIVDLAGGAQPMVSQDGSVVIAFNGEIYNHLGLRAELEARGRQFRTKSDTEAILRGYEEFGADVLSRLRGEFAFVIWDCRKRVLFAARDRLGVKPLYYAVRPDRIVFASEVKALLAHPMIPKRPYLPAIAQYLMLYAPAAPHSPFEGVDNLPAAHALTVSADGKTCLDRYWAPRLAAGPAPKPAEASEEILRLFREATRDRMMSDVPFGAFLSGGVDSGANVAIMTELLGCPVNTFTVGYADGVRHNEFDAARQTANQFGSCHHELRLGRSEFWEAVMELPRFTDGLNGNAECIPLYHLSRYTKQAGVTVVQVGEGADELFGYPGWPELARMNQRLERSARLFGPVARLAAGAGARLLEYTGNRMVCTAFDRFSRGLHCFQGGATPYNRRYRERLAGAALEAACVQTDPEAVVEGWYADAARLFPRLDDYQRMLWVEMCHRLPEHLLARVDRTSMAFGVEARVPFLDHRLVEYVFGLPQEMRFAHGPKTLFKQAVRDRVLPASIVDRPKVPFGTPVDAWLAEECHSQARDLILSSRLLTDGVLDRGAVTKMLDRWPADFRASRRTRQNPYFVLVLARWYDLYFA